MKIGILTFHRSINYGAFMQSYALSNELKKRYPGHEIEIIDFEYKYKHDIYRKGLYKLPFFYEYIIKYRQFKKDLSKLPLSPETFITNEIIKVKEFIKRRYQMVIVGSDAVWAYQNKLPLDNPYWLFGSDLNDIIKVSYAASAFTTIFSSVQDSEKDFLKEKLKSFYYIGVRDIPTQQFIKSIVPEKEIYLNPDPTLFLNPSTNTGLCDNVLRKNFLNPNGRYISFMTRNLPYINEIKKHIGSQYRYIHFNHRNSKFGIFDYKSRFLYNLSPIEWYNLYSCVTMNFSYYFHGALLAIVNHVPTIAFDDSKTYYDSKYKQVMTDLNLSDSLFYSGKIEKNRLFNRVDDILNNIESEKQRLFVGIESEREKSESFFNALNHIL